MGRAWGGAVQRPCSIAQQQQHTLTANNQQGSHPCRNTCPSTRRTPSRAQWRPHTRAPSAPRSCVCNARGWGWGSRRGERRAAWRPHTMRRALSAHCSCAEQAGRQKAIVKDPNQTPDNVSSLTAAAAAAACSRGVETLTEAQEVKIRRKAHPLTNATAISQDRTALHTAGKQ